VIDLSKQKLGRLTVMEVVGVTNQGGYLWSCLCTCGNSKAVSSDNLRRGHTKSCGCLRSERSRSVNTTHGHYKGGKPSKEIKSYDGMKSRCYNPNCSEYNNYGARGIKVCDRWHSFENFYEDMGDCPPGMTLDRKDNNGDYGPDNCKWSTLEEQCNNRRSNYLITYGGKTQTMSQWAREVGIKPGTLRARLHMNNWSEERALTTPVSGGST
jgi:hypothetical protein